MAAFNMLLGKSHSSRSFTLAEWVYIPDREESAAETAQSDRARIKLQGFYPCRAVFLQNHSK